MADLFAPHLEATVNDALSLGTDPVFLIGQVWRLIHDQNGRLNTTVRERVELNPAYSKLRSQLVAELQALRP